LLLITFTKNSVGKITELSLQTATLGPRITAYKYVRLTTAVTLGPRVTAYKYVRLTAAVK
jgi:hypothetical protein